SFDYYEVWPYSWRKAHGNVIPIPPPRDDTFRMAGTTASPAGCQYPATVSKGMFTFTGTAVFVPNVNLSTWKTAAACNMLSPCFQINLRCTQTEPPEFTAVPPDFRVERRFAMSWHCNTCNTNCICDCCCARYKNPKSREVAERCTGGLCPRNSCEVD